MDSVGALPLMAITTGSIDIPFISAGLPPFAIAAFTASTPGCPAKKID